MDSTSFALSLQLRKCAGIVSSFAEGENLKSFTIQKAHKGDYMESVRNQSKINAQRIAANFKEDSIVKSKDVVLTQKAFQKAVTELKLEVYTSSDVTAFTRDLVKTMGTKKGSEKLLEKAKKDLGALKKVTVLMEKGGSKNVWVKQTEKASKES